MHFDYDPSFGTAGGDAWKKKRHLLTSIPMRQPRSIIDDASEFLTSAFLAPISLFGGPQGPQSRPEDVFNGNIELNEEDIVEEERGEEGEVDNSAELLRRVKVIAVDDTAETWSLWLGLG